MEALSLWPSIGLAALNQHKAYAWRAWELARHFDTDGSGVVSHNDLMVFFTLNLDLSFHTARIWLQKATRAGFFQPLTRKNGEKIYLLTGVARVASLLNLERVDSRRVQVKVKDLIGKGWRKNLWAAYLSVTKERPISRKAMREITGVPERTQRELERKLGNVTYTQVFVHDHTTPTEHLNYLKFDHPDYPKPHAFTRYDATLERSIIVWRAPDIRHVPASLTSRGRSKKVNLSLAFSSLSGRERVRLFHTNHQGIKTAQKQLVKYSIPDSGQNSVQALFLQKTGAVWVYPHTGCVQYEYIPATNDSHYRP